MNKYFKTNIVKYIAVLLSVLLFWESVSFADADALRKNTLQVRTLITGPGREDAFSVANTMYLLGFLSRLESESGNHNVTMMKEKVEALIKELLRDPQLDSSFKEILPGLIHDNYGTGELILDAGVFKVRYYNPGVRKDASGDGDLNVIEERTIGRYLKRQVLLGAKGAASQEETPGEKQAAPLLGIQVHKDELFHDHYHRFLLEAPSEGDLDAVLSLYITNLRNIGEYNKAWLNEYRNNIRGWIKESNDDASRIFIKVVRSGGRVVGYIFAEVEGGYDGLDKELYLTFVGVDPELRGEGIAASIILQMCEWAFGHGFHKVTATPHVMREVFKILGFRVVESGPDAELGLWELDLAEFGDRRDRIIDELNRSIRERPAMEVDIEELLDIVEEMTTSLNRRHLERIIGSFDILWQAGRKETKESALYGEIARRFITIHAADSLYGRPEMMNRQPERPIEALAKRGIKVDKDSPLGILLYGDVFRSKEKMLKRIEESGLSEPEKSMLKEMFVYFCVADSIEMGSDHLRKVELREAKGEEPRGFETPKEAYTFAKHVFRKEWGSEIETEFLKPEAVKILDVADKKEKPADTKNETLQKAQRLVELAEDAWKPTNTFGPAADLDIARAEHEREDFSIQKNAEKAIHSLVETFITASERSEATVLALDLGLGQGEINRLLRNLVDIIPELENNNGELKMFLRNLIVVKGDGAVLAGRLKNITSSERGRIRPDNVIIITKNSNIGYFDALKDRATIASVDDSTFPETAYLPLIEIMLFAAGRYLGWDRDALFRHYELIPNVVSLDELNEREAAALFASDRTLIIRLIPNARELGVNDLRVLMNNLQEMLSRA